MKWILFFYIITLWVLLIVISKPPWDNSDSESERSGLIVYTDHHTGVQYLSTPFGSLSPRLNVDGSLVTVNKD